MEEISELTKTLKKKIAERKSARPTGDTPGSSSNRASSDCEKCNDTGYIAEAYPVGHPKFGKLTRCECRAEQDARALQDQIGSPVRDVTLSSMIRRGEGSREIIQTLEDFLADIGAGWSITIYGTNGNGKTTALMAAVNECLDRNVRAVYLTASEFTEYIKGGIGDKFDEESRLDQIADVPVLALDELAAMRPTEYNMDKVERLIDLRYRAGRDTLMAMDENPEGLFHSRLTSRMRAGVIIHNTDPDMRPAISETKK